MTEPLVSVIVPVYKVEKYLSNCIESVINQTYSNWELILVDDGSPDNCPKICDDYAQLDGRIVVIHKPNGGLSDARNLGLENMKGEFVTFLDSDDFWHKDYLKILMGLQSQQNADIVQCKWTRGNDFIFPNVVLNNVAQVFNGPTAIYTGHFDVMMWCKLYRKSLFNGIRMPVGLVNEDDWTSWKICYKARCFVYTEDKLYYYTFNQHGICANQHRTLNLSYWGAYKEKDEFFRKQNDLNCVVWNLKKWNKSIILSYKNGSSTIEQKKQMKSQFESNFMILCQYKEFDFKSRLYFLVFMMSPKFISNCSDALRNLIRDKKITRYK